MITSLARFISFITNPFFVLFPGCFLLVYRFEKDSWYAFKWGMFSFLFVVFVGIFTYFEVTQGVFTDVDISHKEQRPLWFTFVAVASIFYLISLYILQGPPILYLTILGVMIGIFVLSYINQKVKASIHVATLTGVLLSGIVLYGLPKYILLLIPVVAWARIRVERHSLLDTIVGALYGILLTGFMYILIKYIFHYPAPIL